ncbi:MAG: sugar phosphate isomerase/epimerase, partial [Oscillospiraceae bacterium]|nr:sugar phosphate isomerase/epimerase [Oscillospiraceae bacterium]
IDRLRHMHLHDQVQAKGDHLPFGKGALELEKYLQLAQQHDCRAVIEVKTIDGLRQSVDWLKARGWM